MCHLTKGESFAMMTLVFGSQRDHLIFEKRGKTMGHYTRGGYYKRTKRIKDETLPERIKECLKVFKEENNNKLIGVSESFLEQYEKYKGLTESQINYLESWERRVKDPETSKWKETYKNKKEMRDLFREAVCYYEMMSGRGPAYFSRQVKDYYANPEHYCPTLLTYEKMTSNKYFKRYKREKESAPKFRSGDLALGRSNAQWNYRGALFLVLGETGVVDACKGGRWYKAYCLIRSPDYRHRSAHYTTELREKDIKTFRRKK